MAVENRTSYNSKASGWAPMAALRLEVTLAPGEEKSFLFRLGYVENPEAEKFSAPGVINKTRAHALLSAYDSVAQFDAALSELKAYWAGLLSRFTVKSSE